MCLNAEIGRCSSASHLHSAVCKKSTESDEEQTNDENINSYLTERVMETGKMEDERREGGRLCVGVVYSRDLSTAAFFLCVCVCVYEREGE